MASRQYDWESQAASLCGDLKRLDGQRVPQSVAGGKDRSELFRKLAKHAGRITGHKGERCNVSRNDGASGDYAAQADGYTLQDNRIDSNPRVIMDLDRLSSHRRPILLSLTPKANVTPTDPPV
jgi:hypothetical protein